MEKIQIEISKDGSISYEVHGVRGAGCRNLTRAIDQIAGTVLETKNTREYAEQPVVRQSHLKAGG